MSLHTLHSDTTSSTVQNVEQSLSTLLYGQEHNIRLALCSFLCGGHVLLEGVPGVGKTTFAHHLCSILGLGFKRVQCTSDMLPSDVVGYSVYAANTGTMDFRPGPIFTQSLLVDEINRASPKTQSAFLEAMAERQVTVDNTTHTLPEPFFVIATQNPTQQLGTFTLPEAQLDRFLMALYIDYPARDIERDLLKHGTQSRIIEPQLTSETALKLQQHIATLTVSDAIIDYISDLLHYSRNPDLFAHGLSPRAGLHMVNASKAWAFMQGRDYVLPEDVQAIFPAIASHRLSPLQTESTRHDIGTMILHNVPIP